MRVLVILIILLVAALAVYGNDVQTEAATQYMAGIDAWNAGDVDAAILAWEEVLKLKPDSGPAKDKLIMALKKKVESLELKLTSILPRPNSPIIIGATNNVELGTDAVESNGVRVSDLRWELVYGAASADSALYYAYGTIENISNKIIPAITVYVTSTNTTYGVPVKTTGKAFITQLAPGEKRDFRPEEFRQYDVHVDASGNPSRFFPLAAIVDYRKQKVSDVCKLKVTGIEVATTTPPEVVK